MSDAALLEFDRDDEEDVRAAPAADYASARRPALTRMQMTRSMHIWMIEGSIATVFGTLTTGTFQTGFALKLGCGSFVLGVLAAIPAFVGLLQAVSSYYAQSLPSLRKIVCLTSLAGRLMWLPLLAIPFVLPRSLWLGSFLTLTLLSFALQSLPAPLWMEWVSEIVPADKRGRYFGRRNLYAGLTNIAVSIAGGAFLDFASQHRSITQMQAFAVLFAGASSFALVSLWLGLSSDEAPRTAKQVGRFDVRDIIATYAAPLRDPAYRKVIVLGVWVVAIQTMTAQFIPAYSLQYLKINYSTLQLLNAVATVTSLLSMPVWGYLADKFGSKPVTILASLLVTPVAMLWCFTWPDTYPGLWLARSGAPLLVSTSKLMIVFINLTAGVGWAGVGLGLFNLQIGLAPREMRSVYISASSALAGLAGGISPLLGGALMEALKSISFPATGPLRMNYHVLFLLSSLLRIFMVAAAVAITEMHSRSPRYVLGQLRSGNPVGAATALQRLTKSSDSDTRRRAAEELGRLKAPIAVEELVVALDDAALPVRESAAEALGQIADTRAVQPLLCKLNDPAAGIASEAAVALGRIGDRAALPELIAAAGATTAQPERRIAAIEALGLLPQPEALDAILKAASDGERPLRQAALRALAGRPHPFPSAGAADAVVILRALWSGETDEAMLAMLADALCMAGDPASAALLAEGLGRVASPVARRELLNAIGSLLAGRDSFYVYLALDRFAADEAVSRILGSLHRQLRPTRRTDPEAGAAARAVVRIRQALRAYTAGDMDRAARLLAQSYRLLRASRDLRTTEARASRERAGMDDVFRILAGGQSPADPQDILLLVFLLRHVAHLRVDS